MSYEVDDDAVQALDAPMRGSASPMDGGTGRIVDWKEVDAWAARVHAAHDKAEQALEELAQEVGWSAIVESLRAKGVLRDTRWDGWWA